MLASRIACIALAATAFAGAAQAQGLEYNKIQLNYHTTADGKTLSGDLPTLGRATTPKLMLPSATGTYIPRNAAQNQTVTVGGMKTVAVGTAQSAAQPKPLKAK